MEDLTGKKYGRWTVLNRAKNHITSGGYAVTMWECICECGNKRNVRGNDLKHGKSKSCGCLLADNPAAKKHGATGSHLYMIYHSMKARCYNINNKDYRHYGARGIRICDEWQKYEAFEKWALSNGYKDGLTIERINVEVGYSPNNCKWITMKEQQKNKRNSIVITYRGIQHTAAEWDKILGFNRGTVRDRIIRGWSCDEAISIPFGQRRNKLPKMTDMVTEEENEIE